MKTIFLSLFLPFMLFAAVEVGTCLSFNGNVSIERNGVQNVLLERGASIFVQDIIQLAEDARMQIKIIDGTLLNLIPGSRFQVTDFSERKGVFSSSLFTGGMRGITGSMAKKNTDQFIIRTPTATIGIRGTVFSINLLSQASYFSCESGNISIANQAGVVLLGPKQKQQYAVIHGKDDAPLVLPKRPDALNYSNFLPPTGSGCQ